MAADGPETTPSTFAELGLPAPLVDALAAEGITAPFPIQAATVPDALAGRDVLGKGRTGSGKTYAFALPLLARVAASGQPRRPGKPRALVLAPTRELATQIHAAIAPLAAALKLRARTVFGGVRPQPQIAALRKGVDVLVACPGRLADHLGAGHVSLDEVQLTVLDEADHMTDLGFLPVITKLLEHTPADAQRLLFSATLDDAVDTLVRRFLDDPVTHSVEPASEQDGELEHHLLHVRRADRLPVLAELAGAPGRCVVFTRTKRGATRLAGQLSGAGVPAVELQGNLPQRAREKNLAAFANGSATALVATDIAARGIHVDDVGLVIHADPPVEHKAYLHRSGRTGRAGASGTVVTLVTHEQTRDVAKLTRKAGIKAESTSVEPGHPILHSLAPGERDFVPGEGSFAEPDAADERGAAGRSGSAGERGAAGARGGARGPERDGRRAGGAQTRGGRAGAQRASQGGAAAGRSGGARRDDEQRGGYQRGKDQRGQGQRGQGQRGKDQRGGDRRGGAQRGAGRDADDRPRNDGRPGNGRGGARGDGRGDGRGPGDGRGRGGDVAGRGPARDFDGGRGSTRGGGAREGGAREARGRNGDRPDAGRRGGNPRSGDTRPGGSRGSDWRGGDSRGGGSSRGDGGRAARGQNPRAANPRNRDSLNGNFRADGRSQPRGGDERRGNGTLRSATVRGTDGRGNGSVGSRRDRGPGKAYRADSGRSRKGAGAAQHSHPSGARTAQGKASAERSNRGRK